MTKYKLNESHIRVMAELAVAGIKSQMAGATYSGSKEVFKRTIQKKTALIDCLQRLEFADLIKEIE